MYVCICKGVTEGQIQQAVRQQGADYKAVREQLGVATDCGQCGQCAKQVIKECDTDLFVEVA